MQRHEETQRVVAIGKGSQKGTDNAIYTSKYNIFNFLPIAIKEQFRRNGNLYFLVMGILMFIGTYTALFDSSVSPWTTLGPLAIVISISLAQEGAADLKRHKSDRETNNHPGVVIRRVDEMGEGAERDKHIMGGKDVHVVLINNLARPTTSQRKTVGTEHFKFNNTEKIANVGFQCVRRMDMRAGDIVLVKNREMVPADIILLASSGENGAAYIETSPIDGETNLKLRSVPQLPLELMEDVSTPRNLGNGKMQGPARHPKFESLERAVKRITRISLLGYPHGAAATRNPRNLVSVDDCFVPSPIARRRSSLIFRNDPVDENECVTITEDTPFVTSITSEAPNASVNTFSGKITLPPTSVIDASMDIPLGPENLLLRGAVLRNTEWAIGVACFTGEDTKLARNSIKTPSKFSSLDVLMNRTVIIILFIMIVCVLGLAVLAEIEHQSRFNELWYAGYNVQQGEKWPYLPNFEAPQWKTTRPPFFSFVFTFITLLNNFVPLSLYVTVEVITLFMMLLIGWDRDMYHKETDTPAAARSTIVTDLGQVKYVFSDKTGTLTQNIMKFKRCSVDGMIFGAPVEKKSSVKFYDDRDDNDFISQNNVFHPLKRLLVGSVALEQVKEEEDGDSFEISATSNVPQAAEQRQGFLTFNAEMFLRVMSICHTVVVEKEIDTSNIYSQSDHSVASSGLGNFLKFRNRSRNNTEEFSSRHDSRLGTVVETTANTDNIEVVSVQESFNDTITANDLVDTSTMRRSKDGAPFGYAYQAESPDEGALVEAASNEFNFQLVGRDSDGVKLLCSSPSLLTVPQIASGLKSGRLRPNEVASETASPMIGKTKSSLKSIITKFEDLLKEPLGRTEEVWKVLAVNKFDSDRKRMSVLVRSPENMGSLPILLCKGADSSMLDPKICEDANTLPGSDGTRKNQAFEEWQSMSLLNMQSQLGVFASEGLRTLVLGIRILTEDECSKWLAEYEKASTSISNRKKLLSEAATSIETKIHIVGATAIEDKLQDGVPETIYNIGRAGIKLWVLTGDKRETAIEIGYSTKVLNPKMHLTDVAEGSEKRTKALIAMEFMRLVKMGKLPQYQKRALQKSSKKTIWNFLSDFCKSSAITLRVMSRWTRRFYHSYIRTVCGLFFEQRKIVELAKIVDEEKQEAIDEDKSNQVRQLAEKLLEDYLNSSEGKEELKFRRKRSMIDTDSHDFDGGAHTVPEVFSRAQSARDSIELNEGHLSQSALRSLSLGSVTADEIGKHTAPVVDEDTLSLMSFVPGESGRVDHIFNKKKRTILEKLFAVDRDVRKGLLVKHLTKEKKREYFSSFDILPQDSAKDSPDSVNVLVERALVIEGSALAYFLDDQLLEELLFAVASSCKSVIACRVSPKQKALLVKLVKQFVKPHPVTLAIGDGANDVGMIQEAQVGVGISGLEGQQAVNASDFSIAQFRFLEDLLLIHGRWNFMRLSKTVLYSFYKNAVLAGLLMAYCRASFFSGTPLFDMWVLSAFNFVCGIPIFVFGMFDRDLEKDYVKRNPHLYASGPNNEHMAMRTTSRWIVLVFIHVNIIYFLCATALDVGGSMTSYKKGLMFNDDAPGDGEVGDMKVFGTVVFVVLNWTLGIKVFYESGSIIHGIFPAFTFRKNVGEGFWSRVGYSWYGLIYLSIGFNFFFLYTYQYIGTIGSSAALSFLPFVMVTSHMFHTSTTNWVVISITTIAATSIDVIGKVFSNMFYPTQTQIHKEIQKLQYMPERKREKES
eukprot:CAMPEP_0176499310 /NCGR_PEP_ID=MMETSP0200_2-20121128/12857_1 /TAXON_ID=947934 /ORGANISM="Chaetoceros sp., Strain GSL56" /LENGTH=1734 /DNA_ID=CAMNT_0017897717 /DNA_START=151 /DNA_END=5351 /DNA_ORIENTATION=-